MSAHVSRVLTAAEYLTTRRTTYWPNGYWCTCVRHHEHCLFADPPPVVVEWSEGARVVCYQIETRKEWDRQEWRKHFGILAEIA